MHQLILSGSLLTLERAGYWGNRPLWRLTLEGEAVGWGAKPRMARILRGIRDGKAWWRDER